ncbi:MAG: copper amine oxidase N-terminal domain-containing protein [Candidatus Nomurabacteria bacterium]|nr:copper amine oxidase N-terminal domain-containing protein [Candidatus Nomurabacteria bacterium]
MKILKKLAAIGVAVAMALSLSVSAFAAAGTVVNGRDAIPTGAELAGYTKFTYNDAGDLIGSTQYTTGGSEVDPWTEPETTPSSLAYRSFDDGRRRIPLDTAARLLAAGFNEDVEYSYTADYATITITIDDIVDKVITTGKNKLVTIDGGPAIGDMETKVDGGVAYVPLRGIVQALNGKIWWNSSTKNTDIYFPTIDGPSNIFATTVTSYSTEITSWAGGSQPSATADAPTAYTSAGVEGYSLTYNATSILLNGYKTITLTNTDAGAGAQISLNFGDFSLGEGIDNSVQIIGFSTTKGYSESTFTKMESGGAYVINFAAKNDTIYLLYK